MPTKAELDRFVERSKVPGTKQAAFREVVAEKMRQDGKNIADLDVYLRAAVIVISALDPQVLSG